MLFWGAVRPRLFGGGWRRMEDAAIYCWWEIDHWKVFFYFFSIFAEPLPPYFSQSSNFPQPGRNGKRRESRESRGRAGRCWRAEVIAISLSLGSQSLSLSTGLCSALLTNKTLRRRVEFSPPKLWCIGFFTVWAAPPNAFSFPLVLSTIFSLSAPLSLSLHSPLRLSEYHLQFNAHLGWALTIDSSVKWFRPCLHA